MPTLDALRAEALAAIERLPVDPSDAYKYIVSGNALGAIHYLAEVREHVVLDAAALERLDAALAAMMRLWLAEHASAT